MRTTTSTIAVIGPGAIGTALAARLASGAGHDVTVAVRTPFRGLELHDGEHVVRAEASVITDPAQATPVDWVLVTTKAYDAEGAARWLPGLMHETTRVAIVQNGVEHVERFAPWVDSDRLLPVMIDLPAERSAPGVVRQRGAGVLTVPDSPAGVAFVRVFAGSGLDVRTTDDMTTALWRKLCINSVGALNAVTLAPPRIARDDAVAELMREIVHEAVAVGRAEGAELPDDLADEIVAAYRAGPGDGINSLHADRLAGRPMEIDARNGAIVRAGARHGIPTPRNELLVALLGAIERYGAGR
ncbi:2-dehydropantoate 2-reductase [Agromyces sp. SYSU T00194]|uniref:2-dehydropantoate 2-reductase n=1 Tax=Agromyces chitinivorans TaxID=3158560 RepID=UPI00339B39BD